MFADGGARRGWVVVGVWDAGKTPGELARRVGDAEGDGAGGSFSRAAAAGGEVVLARSGVLPLDSGDSARWNCGDGRGGVVLVVLRVELWRLNGETRSRSRVEGEEE